MSKIITFLLPGIDGQKMGLESLAHSLLRVSQEWDIAIPNSLTKPSSIEEQVNSLLNGINNQIKTLDPCPPICLVGFSFGSILATQVGQKLKKANHKVFVCILDAPIRELYPAFYKQDQISATLNLINIISYFSRLAGYSTSEIESRSEFFRQSNQAKLSEPMQELIALPLVDTTANNQFNKLCSSLKISFTEPKATQFNNFAGIISKNLQELLIKPEDSKKINNAAHSSTGQAKSLDSVLVLSTKETRSNFADQPDLGWGTLSKKVIHDYIDGDHLSIISSEKSSTVANFIVKNVEKLLKEQHIQDYKLPSTNRMANLLKEAKKPFIQTTHTTGMLTASLSPNTAHSSSPSPSGGKASSSSSSKEPSTADSSSGSEPPSPVRPPSAPAASEPTYQPTVTSVSTTLFHPMPTRALTQKFKNAFCFDEKPSVKMEL